MKPSPDFIVEKFNGKLVSDTWDRVQVMVKFDNGLGASVLWYRYEI